MALKRKFSKGDIRKGLNSYQARIEFAIQRSLEYVGESFIADARTNGSYRDQTGNLRSSVGYLILKNGKIIRSVFPQADSGSERAKGAQTGASYARRLAQEFGSKGFTFIGVAGMEYAAAVESRGRTVITSSSEKAKKNMEHWLQEVKKKMSS